MCKKNSPIQHEIEDSQIERIMSNPLFLHIIDGIERGQILPALRKSEVHFYEGGARLFRFKGSRAFTHEAYIDGTGKKERVVNEVDSVTAERIRKNARGHKLNKQDDSELAAVHALFQNFAITKTDFHEGELALIDIEARFSKDDNAEPKLRANMIDLVFLLPDKRLLFIEAKCVGNPAVRSTGSAAVVKQVQDYERHIKRKGVLDALNRSLKMQSRLVDRNLGQAESVYPRVPILVLDPTKKGISHRSKDTWLRNALARSEKVSSDPIVINGMEDPEAAIRRFVEVLPL